MKKVLYLLMALLIVSMTGCLGSDDEEDAKKDLLPIEQVTILENQAKNVSVKFSSNVTEKFDVISLAGDIVNFEKEGNSIAIEDLFTASTILAEISSTINKEFPTDDINVYTISEKQELIVNEITREFGNIILELNKAIQKNENISFEKEMFNGNKETIVITPAHLVVYRAYVKEIIAATYYFGAYNIEITESQATEILAELTLKFYMSQEDNYKIGDLINDSLPEKFLTIKNNSYLDKSKEYTISALDDMEEALKYLKSLGEEGNTYFKELFQGESIEELSETSQLENIDGLVIDVELLKDLTIDDALLQIENAKDSLNGTTFVEIPLEAGKIINVKIDISKMFEMNYRNEIVKILNCVNINTVDAVLEINKSELAKQTLGGYFPNGIKAVIDKFDITIWNQIPEEYPLEDTVGTVMELKAKLK